MYTSREKRFRAKVIGGEITRKTDALVILKKKFPKDAEGLYFQINIKLTSLRYLRRNILIRIFAADFFFLTKY